MFDDGAGAGETAISYTDQFLDAAIAKIDATFGPGYAKQNPALVDAYLRSCSMNLSSFIQSAFALSQIGALEGLEDLEEMEKAPPRRRRGR